MKKYKLLATLFLCSHGLMAQRIHVSDEDSIKGLQIFGVMVMLVFLVTIILYVRQRNRNR